MIDAFLEDLENRIQVETEAAVEAAWEDFLSGKNTDPLFEPRRPAAPSRLEWTCPSINSGLDDMEKMLLRELYENSEILRRGWGGLLNIRCNYGTSILPSLFGVQPFFMEERHDTLPTSLPLGDAGKIAALVADGIPDLSGGWGQKVFDTVVYFQKKLAPYPKLRRYMRIYHPDLQGPADCAELLWGSAMFLAFYDEPELLQSSLRLVTETYKAFLHRYFELCPERGDFGSHWHFAYRGSLMLRNDSIMNLSPETYAEFIAPLDRELLTEFGGGAVHFCGRGDHYIDQLTGVVGASAIQLSQPEHNDMEKVLRCTVDRGVPLLRFNEKRARELLRAGRNLHGLVHC